MLICPHCGTDNPLEASTCSACARKLLVVSGTGLSPPGEDSRAGVTVTLEEHLVERISLTEEALRNLIEGLQQTLATVRRLERNALVTQAGLTAVEEVLVGGRMVGAETLRRHWDRHLRASLLAMEKRDVLEARREAVQADFAGLDADRFTALLDQAAEAFAALDSSAAVDTLERALELDRGNPQLASLVGELDFLAGRHQRALEHFAGALERDPRQYDALVYSGILLYRLGKLDQARRRLQRAVEVRPNEFLGWFSLGSLVGERGDLRESVVYLERAVEIDRVPAALALLGRCYRQMGKLTRATTTLEEALQAEPSLDEARYDLGRTFAARGWHRRAERELCSALELNPVAHGYGILSPHLELPAGADSEPLQQAREMALSGRFTPAEQAAEAAYRGSDQPRVQTVAAAVLIESLRAEGRLREGIEWAERLLEVDDVLAPTVAGCEIAWSLAELEEDLDRALEVADRGLASAPEPLIPHAGAAVGWVHYKRGELDSARRKLEKAAELGENAFHLKLLGVVCLAQGEAEAAEEFLNRAELLPGATIGQALREQWLDRLWRTGRHE